MGLPTLFELGVQKGQGVHHQFQNKHINIELGRFIEICWCGRAKEHVVHYPAPKKVKKVPVWKRNFIKEIDDVPDFLNKWRNHRRFKVFYHKGVRCVRCDRTGVKIIKYLDRADDPRSIHHDLFTEDDILMTVDHILPKYHGGTDDLDNLQPMCGPCNFEKGSQIETTVEETKNV